MFSTLDKNILFKSWRHIYIIMILQYNMKKQSLQANSDDVMMTI